VNRAARSASLDESLKRESQQTPALAGRRQRNFSRLLGALPPLSYISFLRRQFVYRRFIAFSLVPLQIFSVYVLIFRFSALSFGTHIELHRCSFQQCLYDAQKSAAATSFSSALLTILTRFARLSAVKNTRRIESNARAGYHYEA